MKLFIFVAMIAAIALVNCRLKRPTEKNIVNYEWDTYSDKSKFLGQGNQESCQTFSVVRGMQICLNYIHKNSNVFLDASEVFLKIKGTVEPNEYHVISYLKDTGIKDKNSDKLYKFSVISSYKGVVAKYGLESIGFRAFIEPGKDPRDDIMDFIKIHITKGPITVGCNYTILRGEIKQRLRERMESGIFKDDQMLITECEKSASRLTHVILITGKKTVKVNQKDVEMYSIVDSAGDFKNGSFNEKLAFLSLLTSNEVKKCLTFAAASIDCSQIIES